MSIYTQAPSTWSGGEGHRHEDAVVGQKLWGGPPMSQPLSKLGGRQTDQTVMDVRNAIHGKNLVTECFITGARSIVNCPSRRNLLSGWRLDRTARVLACNGRADRAKPRMT